MKIIKSVFFTFGLLCAFQSQTNAQGQSPDHFHDAEGNTYHQVFLDFQVTEILEINYPVDGLPVDGELAPDGYSVVIKNYPGDKSVKMKVKDVTGQVKEITKSRCFIDPVLLVL